MKLLMISNQGNYSHIQTHIYYIARIIRNNETELTILTPNDGGWSQKMAQSGYQVTVLDFLKSKFKAWIAFYKYLKLNHFDVIHAHDIPPFWGIVARWASKTSRLVHTFHSGGVSSKLGFLDKISLRKMDHVITIAANERLKFIEQGVPAQLLEHIPYGISERFYVNNMPYQKSQFRRMFHLPDRGFLVGALGRFEKRNGFTYLIDALNLLKADTDVKLALIGDGPQKSELMEKIHQCHLKTRIHFTGFCDRIYDIIPALDLLIIPYVTNEYSIIPLEAMAAGVPVVAFSQPYLEDLAIEFESIALVPEKDTEALAESIRELYKDEAKLDSLALSAFMKAQEYHQELMMEKIKEIYGIKEE